MAATCICEGCGAVKPVKQMVHVRVHDMASPEQYMTRAVDHFDICNECHKKLLALLEHKEKKK